VVVLSAGIATPGGPDKLAIKFVCGVLGHHFTVLEQLQDVILINVAIAEAILNELFCLLG